MPTFTLPSAIASPWNESTIRVSQTSHKNQPQKLGRCGPLVVATHVILQNSIALVFQFVVNPDLRRVIALYGQSLQLEEKTNLGKIRHVVVVRKHREYRDPILSARVHERFSVVMLAHDIDQSEPF